MDDTPDVIEITPNLMLIELTVESVVKPAALIHDAGGELLGFFHQNMLKVIDSNDKPVEIKLNREYKTKLSDIIKNKKRSKEVDEFLKDVVKIIGVRTRISNI